MSYFIGSDRTSLHPSSLSSLLIGLQQFQALSLIAWSYDCLENEGDRKIPPSNRDIKRIRDTNVLYLE
ncbi:hypothetical protein [Nostoc sp.]|uniref:hypothetical protein n=1 Tax=Nostoc sp. TaxID=1180 RepID=UPI002FF6CF60